MTVRASFSRSASLCSLLPFSLCQNIREVKVLRRYHIQVREDYLKYNRLVGGIHKSIHMLKKMSPNDPYRIQATEQLMNKLFNMGLIPSNKNLAEAEKITVSSFCR